MWKLASLVRPGALAIVLAAVAGWGSDGSHRAGPGKIAFAGSLPSRNYGIQVVGPDGRGRRALTRHVPTGMVLGYRAGGRKLVFDTPDGYYMMSDPDGSNAKLIAEDAVSPDGRFLAAFSRKDIVIETTAGHIVRRIPMGFRGNDYTDAIEWSPDRRRLLVRELDQASFDQRIQVVGARGDGLRTLIGWSHTLNLDPHWSPDGRRILFSRSTAKGPNDVYVMNADGTRQRLLARGIGNGSEAVWSPRGNLVAYSSQKGGVYVVGADGGGARRVFAGGGRPAWSPKGDVVADGRGGVYRVGPAGGRPVLILRHSGPVSSLSWWPGKRLAFNLGDDIATLAADGTARQLSRKVADQLPAWSPDGRRIAFTRSRGLLGQSTGSQGEQVWVMNADGTRQRLLASGFAADWSPDGRRLVFEAGFSTASGLGSRVEVVNADGTGLRVVARGASCCATWSPDRSSIALLRFFFYGPNPHVDYASALEVIASDGSKPRLLVDGRKQPFFPGTNRPRFGELLELPRWSPDGQSIAFTVQTGNDPNNMDEYRQALATVDLDGTTTTLVKDDQSGGSNLPATDVRWSPDGRELAYTPDTSGRQTVRVVPVTGGAPRTILPDSGESSEGLAWQPDGSGLTVSRCHEDDSTCDLVFVRRNGTGHRRLTTTPGMELEPAWQPTTP